MFHFAVEAVTRLGIPFAVAGEQAELGRQPPGRLHVPALLFIAAAGLRLIAVDIPLRIECTQAEGPGLVDGMGFVEQAAGLVGAGDLALEQILLVIDGGGQFQSGDARVLQATGVGELLGGRFGGFLAPAANIEQVGFRPLCTPTS